MSAAHPLPQPLVSFTFAGRLCDVYLSDRLTHLEGKCCTTAGRLLLSDELTTDERAEVLFHELVHLVDLSTTDNDNRLTESEVVRLSRLLWGVLRENPQLLKPLGLWPRP